PEILRVRGRMSFLTKRDTVVHRHLETPAATAETRPALSQSLLKNHGGGLSTCCSLACPEYTLFPIKSSDVSESRRTFIWQPLRLLIIVKPPALRERHDFLHRLYGNPFSRRKPMPEQPALSGNCSGKERDTRAALGPGVATGVSYTSTGSLHFVYT